MALTIRKLAQLLRVSPGTVSKALSGGTGIREDLAREIRQRAQELGYHPSPMRRRVNRSIGLVICGSLAQEQGDDSYQMRLTATIVERVSRFGWHMNSEVLTDPAAYPALLLEKRVDGVLLCGNPPRSLCDAIRKADVPGVVLDDVVERTGLTSVSADAGQGTEAAVRHLRDMGHRRIAMVATVAKYPTVLSRVEGFRRGAEGLPPDDAPVLFAGTSSVQQGQTATRQLLQRRNKPTAIIFLTDLLAVGGMFALLRMGLDVPGDISIVGHNNTLLAQKMEPPVSSVDLNLGTMVDAGIRLLIERIQEPERRAAAPSQCLIPVHVHWRGSCGPAPS